MTGFARCDGADTHYRWHWELKSVNGRSLDVRTRLGSFDQLDARVKAETAKLLNRGSISINLQATALERTPTIRVNADLLRQIVEQSRQVADSLSLPAPSLDSLMGMRGVLEVTDDAEDEEQTAERLERMFADFQGAVQALSDARLAEGTRLADLVDQQLTTISELTQAASQAAAAQPEQIREKVRQQITDMLGSAPPLPEERLAQEAAVLATKADIREELDRLNAHVAAARDLLAAGSPIGRKFDFLAQEFNREANTFCSKVTDVGLKNMGLELKAVIEQMREQIQNIE